MHKLEILRGDPSNMTNAIPIWRVRKNNFDEWVFGRVFIEDEHEYKVKTQ